MIMPLLLSADISTRQGKRTFVLITTDIGDRYVTNTLNQYDLEFKYEKKKNYE